MTLATAIPPRRCVQLFRVEQIRYLMGRMGDNAREEGEDFDKWTPDLLRTAWVAIYLQGHIVALSALEKLDSVTVGLHHNVLPEYRAGARHESLATLFEWLLRAFPEYRKVTARVPVLYPHIRRFAHEMGFQDEGVDRASYRRNGALHDRWHLGITADEMRQSYVQHL